MTEKILKLPHKLSKDFVSHVATGAILSGPTGDGLFHFVFYRDAVWIEYESGRPTENENIYESYIETGDIKNFREDQARISMSEQVLRSLPDLILKKLLSKKEESKTADRA